jgi:Putative peptidoglycan binding domain
MTRSDFDIEPFAFREDRHAWETERRSGPAALTRTTRGTPRRRRPPLGRRWPGAIRFIEPAHCCACPANGVEFAADDERFEFEAVELESPAGMPTLRLGSRGSAVIDLQRRLATAGFSAGTADGIFGSRTDGAVRSFQRARGLGVDGVVGPQTWGALLGTTTAPQPAPNTGSPSEPQVTIPSGVLISDNAVRVLKDILRAAGLTRATVTSGRRTSSEQARIMYELIERNGVSYAKNLYASSGDDVIEQYVAAKAAGKSATAVKLAMETRIRQLGCQHVSHHCSDSYDVFDVAPSSITDSSAFRRALDSAVFGGAIRMYLSPPEDPAFHIEIALAPGSGELDVW